MCVLVTHLSVFAVALCVTELPPSTAAPHCLVMHLRACSATAWRLCRCSLYYTLSSPSGSLFLMLPSQWLDGGGGVSHGMRKLEQKAGCLQHVPPCWPRWPAQPLPLQLDLLHLSSARVGLHWPFASLSNLAGNSPEAWHEACLGGGQALAITKGIS